jgi:hypothetical protein
MMIGYDIYDRFTIEHFPFCQRMILTTSLTVHTVESRMQNVLIVNVTKKLFVMFMSEFCNLHCVIKAYCHQKVKNNLNVN